MVNVRSSGTALLGIGDAAALVLLRDRVAELAARVGHPRAWVLEVGVDRALVVAAGAAVWLAAAWLGLGLLAALGSRLPGAAGRLGACVGRRVLPRVLLGLVTGTAGVGVLLAPVAAGADPAPGPTPAVSAPSWPVTPPVTARPIAPPSWPTAVPTPVPATVPTTVPTTVPAPATAAIRVQAGDSLWLLAGRRLGPHPTDRQIAATWPRWFAANRDVIGADPALITPGQRLRLPAPIPTSEETR